MGTVYGRDYPIKTRRGDVRGDGFCIHAYDADLDAAAELVTGLATTYAQIASAEAAEILSSDTNDTTQTVRISGIEDTNGTYVTESNLLTGTTPVTTTTVWRYIDQIWVDIECAGTVTVRKATGDATINQITIGSLVGDVAQHFNGEYRTVIQKWWAVNYKGTDEVTLDLRWYPDDADCLDDSDGFMVLDRIHLLPSADTPPIRRFSDDPDSGLLLPKGGWLAVYGTGASADEGAAVNVVGFDII